MSLQQINVVEMLARNEEAISQLYHAYSEKFPESKGFWLGLADEEIGHAGSLRELHSKIHEGSVYLDESRFKVAAIKTFLDYLEREVAKTREQGVSLINALSTALYIEEALIERKYFEVFETDSVDLKHVLLDLAASTEEHVRRVREVQARYRRSSP